MKLAFKYRFYPTSEQARILAQTFGCVRYVYNFGLALRKESYEQEEKSLSYKDTSSALTQLKKAEETTWLNDVSCVPLQQSLRHLNTAYSNFFRSLKKSGKHTSFPSFKSKHHKQSAEYTRSAFKYSLDEQSRPVLKLAKMKRPLKVKWSRIPPSTPSSVTVSRDKAGRYFVSLLCEHNPEPLPTAHDSDGIEKEIGIDLGLTHFAITSDGVKFDNPRHLEHDLHKLKRAQKALSRKQKGSNNRYKARLKVARIHARITDRRKDFLHKLSTQLIRENQAIYVETLNVKGMMKNHCLARHIAGASWSEFVRQLAYKTKLYSSGNQSGRTLAKIGRFVPSSKTCNTCKHQVKELPLNVRTWTCERCGSSHDRDINAAKNILRVGQTLKRQLNGANACGENVRPETANATKGCLDETRILTL